MFSSACRHAEVRSSAWLVPSSSTGMPMVAVNRRGMAQRGSVKSSVRANRGQRMLLPRGLAPVHREAHRAGRGHLDRRDAHLAIALGEVGVARRKQRALDVDRQEELCAAGELLDVEVAAVLARRQRAQSLRRGRAAGWHRALGVRRQGKAAPTGTSASRFVQSATCCADGATPETPMNGGARDAHAGQLRRGRPAVGDLPVHQERRRSSRRAGSPRPGMMAEKAQGCGAMSTNSISSRSPGLAPLTKTGPGQRVDRASGSDAEIGRRWSCAFR